MMKKELKIGVTILLVIYPVLSRFLKIPDLFLGFLMGLGLVFTIIGILPKKAYTKVKIFKS